MGGRGKWVCEEAERMEEGIWGLGGGRADGKGVREGEREGEGVRGLRG